MGSKHLNYEDLVEAKSEYNRGQNVTEFLRERGNLTQNIPEIIEAAYDLQAGTYIKSARENWAFSQSYASELSRIMGGGAHLQLYLLARYWFWRTDHLKSFSEVSENQASKTLCLRYKLVATARGPRVCEG